MLYNTRKCVTCIAVCVSLKWSGCGYSVCRRGYTVAMNVLNSFANGMFAIVNHWHILDVTATNTRPIKRAHCLRFLEIII